MRPRARILESQLLVCTGDLFAVFWTEFKRRDVRRKTKQEIPDLTRVHPGDRKVVSSTCFRKLPEILQDTAWAQTASPQPPDTNRRYRSCRSMDTPPTISVPPSMRPRELTPTAKQLVSTGCWTWPTSTAPRFAAAWGSLLCCNPNGVC